MNELMKFDFQFDGWSSEVNVLEIEGEPWFLLKSIANVLEIDDVSNLSRRLKPYEKLTRTLYMAGQNRDILLVSESGLYRLVLTSRKPQAEPFQDWVCQEILPQIRKTGGYNLAQQNSNIPQDYVAALRAAADAEEARLKALAEAERLEAEADYALEQLDQAESTKEGYAVTTTAKAIWDYYNV